MESLKTKQHRAQEITKLLAPKYPESKSSLHYGNPFELLIATLLSAQTTDKRVNMVTATFFPKYNTPEKLLSLGLEKVQELVKSINLYKTKAKHIIALCEILITKHHSTVPRDTHTLETLPGVGRKTANVVLANAFGVPTFAVDTHVFRVSTRLGLSKGKTPLQIERDLTQILPEDLWIDTHNYYIFHGREICHARKPNCPICPIRHLCPYPKKTL